MSNENQTNPDELEEISVEDLQKEEAAAEQEHVGEEVEVEIVEETADEKLVAEADKWRDAALRAEAEMQNLRRRVEKDVESAHKFGQEKLIKELLPVIDNLERAIAAADAENEAVKPLLEGVEMTKKSFSDALAKGKVEEINPVGEPFDPQLHQAMTMVPNPDMEPNTVMDVMQKGYQLHGRLIRPAMVVVSKAP